MPQEEFISSEEDHIDLDDVKEWCTTPARDLRDR